MQYAGVEIITGGDPRFDVNTDGINPTNVKITTRWLEGILKPDLKAIRSMLSQAQSHFKVRAWVKNMAGTYGDKRPKEGIASTTVYGNIRDHYLEGLMKGIGSKGGKIDPSLAKYLNKDGSISKDVMNNPEKSEELRLALIGLINATKNAEATGQHIQTWADNLNVGFRDTEKSMLVAIKVNEMAKVTDKTVREFLLAGLKR